MYCQHFELDEEPFGAEPDPKFVYSSPDNQRQLSALIAGIQEREGLITLAGLQGVGKSVLAETAFLSMPEETSVARVIGNAANFDETLAVVLLNLGLMKPDEALSPREALERLRRAATDLFTKKGYVVVIVKEAQDSAPQFLENLRHIYGLEVNGQKLVRIILSGQPHQAFIIARPELKWLKGQKIHRIDLMPLTEEETYEYIEHRLSMANYKGSDLFNHEALQRIWEYSAGLPQKINMVCRNALLIGYSRGQKTVEAEIVEEAIKEVNWKPFSGIFETAAAVPLKSSSSPAKGKRTRLLRPFLAVPLTLACVILVGTIYYLVSFKSEKKVPIRSSVIQSDIKEDLQRNVDSADMALPDDAVQSDDKQEMTLLVLTEKKDESGSPSIADMDKVKEGPKDIPPDLYQQGIRRDIGEEKKGMDGGSKRLPNEVFIEAKKPVSPAQTPPAQTPKGEQKKATRTTAAATSKTEVAAAGTIVIQVAAFQEKSRAQDLISKLQAAGFKNMYIEETEIKGKGFFYRVRLRDFTNVAEAQTKIAELYELGYADLYIEDRKKL